ncbi:MAG: RNA polymerase sigma factor [Gammaproteobacteria bacterium]
MTPEQRHASALDACEASMASAGDPAAFERLYRRWHPKLLRFAARLLGNRDDAKDVMQDAAIAIARQIHRLSDPGLFGPWAYTIVRRRAADHIQRSVRVRRASASARDAPVPVPPDTDEQLALRQALDRLSPDDRLLLTLFYLHDMTGPELSAAMGIALGTLKSRLFDARARLKKAYDLPLTGASND